MNCENHLHSFGVNLVRLGGSFAFFLASAALASSCFFVAVSCCFRVIFHKHSVSTESIYQLQNLRFLPIEKVINPWGNLL